MDIINLRFEDCSNLVISVNVYAALFLLLLVVLMTMLIKQILNKNAWKSFKFEETTIGIGNSSVTIKYDKKIEEIAYKIWIELTTRKIGIKFDEDYDVIHEVYNSWYEAFKVIRYLLEEIPGNRIDDAKGLIEITTKVLNNGLRPHLTKWQAKYRSWYKNALEQNSDLAPQDIQKKFPEYQALVDDLRTTNDIMINYASELKRLIDN